MGSEHNLAHTLEKRVEELRRLVYGDEAFTRLDEQDDEAFYRVDRFVNHLDEAALEHVRSLIETLVVEDEPVVLDLMSSWDSHLPTSFDPERVVGVGLNEHELAANEALDSFALVDLNRDPHLPFEGNTFDVVLNTVSVDYLTRPFEVFAEVQRVLKPGGLHLVIFSNRMFRDKAVKVWREASEEERVFIVEDYFTSTAGFGPTSQFMVKGAPRSKSDKYASITRMSDPIYAVWAEKEGGHVHRPMPQPSLATMPSPQEVEARKARTRATLCCPYCDQRMSKWQVPLSPFSEWDAEFLYICMNDACPYVQRGWNAMARQGNGSASYRTAYDAARDAFVPMPIPSLRALKDGLVDE